MTPRPAVVPPGTAPTPRPLACLLVEDHTLIAQLLAGVLRTLSGVGSVTVTGTVAESLAVVAARDLDLVILDLKLPDGDGRTVLRSVATRHPQAICIILSSATDEFTCPMELAGHVAALVDKTAPLDSLRQVVEAAVLQRLGGRAAPIPADPARVLRPRELEVFERVGKGMTTREIADAMGITVHTVNSHRKSIVTKLGVVGAELVRVATLYVATKSADDPPGWAPRAFKG